LARPHSYFGQKGLSQILILVIFLGFWENIPGLFGRGKIDHLPFISIIAVTIFAIWHAVGINRRLDALIKLLDSDIKKLAPNAPDNEA
jgi:hypothetical protein